MTKTVQKTMQSLAHLLLKAFRNLKLVIIFKILLTILFVIKYNYIIKKYILKKLYIILLLSYASHMHNTSCWSILILYN